MKIIFRGHAVRRMFERGLSVEDVCAVLADGESIADYADDAPYPSRLKLGFLRGRALHVVAAYNATDDETIVVTAYEPDPRVWEADFRRKKP